MRTVGFQEPRDLAGVNLEIQSSERYDLAVSRPDVGENGLRTVSQFDFMKNKAPS